MMSGTHKALDADHGNDTNKRVEILAAMRERAPGLREVKVTEFAALRTLGQIVEHMRAQGEAGAAAEMQRAHAEIETPTNASAPAGAAPPPGSAPGIHRFATRAVTAAAVGMALPALLAAQ